MIFIDLLEKIRDAVVEGNEELVKELVSQSLQIKTPVKKVMLEGLAKGMLIVGEKYEEKEYFLPEIIISADACQVGMDLLKDKLKSGDMDYKATIVIGVVRGDIHEIGKNITKYFLEASGYKCIDCGRNVKAEVFIKTIKENNADILALATMMTPTLESMREVMKELEKEKIRDKIKVIIGGAAADEIFAKEIGADFYAKDANHAIKILDNSILEVKK
ncbi:MAG: cobalamin B12-binding domain-containing protein [Candidatus Helarchaeota archaeon]